MYDFALLLLDHVFLQMFRSGFTQICEIHHSKLLIKCNKTKFDIIVATLHLPLRIS